MTRKAILEELRTDAEFNAEQFQAHVTEFFLHFPKKILKVDLYPFKPMNYLPTFSCIEANIGWGDEIAFTLKKLGFNFRFDENENRFYVGLFFNYFG